MGEEQEFHWFTRRCEHEGYPLMLRYPVLPDFDTLQWKYPQLLVATHQFEKVQSNGLPDPDYNDALAVFDIEMRLACETEADGLSVLVETFGGRRIYYTYVSSDGAIEQAKARVAGKYPKHQIKWDIKQDPDWSFIRRYTAKYGLYPPASPKSP